MNIWFVPVFEESILDSEKNGFSTCLKNKNVENKNLKKLKIFKNEIKSIMKQKNNNIGK